MQLTKTEMMLGRGDFKPWSVDGAQVCVDLMKADENLMFYSIKLPLIVSVKPEQSLFLLMCLFFFSFGQIYQSLV